MKDVPDESKWRVKPMSTGGCENEEMMMILRENARFPRALISGKVRGRSRGQDRRKSTSRGG